MIMQYREVPKNGDQLSALGFGTMRLATRMGTIAEEQVTRQIRVAIDRGVNYIDTALSYHGGASERVLGRALRDGYRGKVKLATKLPPWSVRTREDMDRILDVQCKKLHTGSIDYYLLHWLDATHWEKLSNLGVLDFLDRAKAAGKIRNTGFSFHGDLATFRQIIDTYDWTMCQIQYNFLDETHQAGTEGLRYAASKNIAVMVMEPMRGGMLAGNLPAGVERAYARAPVQRSAAAWALRWVLNHPEVTVVLSGMNDEKHILENIAACKTAYPGSMTDPELATIAEVAGEYRRLMKVGCTSCAYCMPCPHGVDIPQCFSLYNSYFMGGGRILIRGTYGAKVMGGVKGTPGDASLCRNCGECAQICPQKIAIPLELKNVNRTLGGLRTKLMMPFIRMIFASEVKE